MPFWAWPSGNFALDRRASPRYAADVILSPDEQSVVASFLHRGKYGVKIYDLSTGRTREVRCPLAEGPEVLSISPGKPKSALKVGGLGTHFSVEGWPEGRLNVIAYSWEAPESPVGAISLLGDGSFRVDGDPSIWLHPPYMYPDYFPKVIRIKEAGPELTYIHCEPPDWLVNS